jgi:hypothetical protein
MGRRYGSEENLFGQWAQPVQQPTGTSELPSTATNAFAATVAANERGADKFSRTSQHLAEEQAAATREDGKMLGDAFGNIAKNYQEGGRYATEMDERKQKLDQNQIATEQMQRNAARDVTYGDKNAEVASQQGQASLASTQAGTAATKQSTAAAEAKLPGELQQQKQQSANNQQALNTMRIEAKKLGLETGNYEDEIARNSIAAQVAQVRAKAATPAEADKLEEEWSRQNGRAYTTSQLASGRRLGKVTNAQDALVVNSAITSDPKFQVASTFKQKAAAAANTMAELTADLNEYKNNGSLFLPDSAAAQQAQQRIESKLAALEQTKLLSNVQMNSIRRALQPGQSWTTAGALTEAVQSASHMLQASLVRESDMLAANPHITAGERQQYLNQIRFDPNAPKVQQNPAAKFNVQQPGAGGMMPVNQGAPSGPPNLREGRGAIPLTQPPIQPVGK